MSSIQPIHLDAELLTKTLNRYRLDLRRLRRTLIAVLARLDAAQILADELEANLLSLVKLFSGPQGGEAVTSIALGLGSSRQGGLEPVPVARSLEAIRRTDGFFDVRIDCSEDAVRLPPQLGSLLKFLAEGKNSDPQESVVGWRAREEIVAHLKSLRTKADKSRGKEDGSPDRKEEEPKIDPSFPSKLVYLLRERLGRHGRLVESNRQKGWRFSLRRGDAGNVVQTRLAERDRRAVTGRRAKPQPAARPATGD